MTPSIRTVVWAVLCLALARPASSAGWDADRILMGRDPEAAAAFLADDAGQARLRAENPDLYRGVFAHAVDLKSVADLLRGDGGSFTVREKLRALPDCAFCQDPEELSAWARTLVPALDDKRLGYLDAALLDWDTLPEPLRRLLSQRGLGASQWAALSLPRRSTAIEPWLEEQFILLMKEMPRTKDEMKDFSERSDRVILLLTQGQSDRLEERADTLGESFVSLDKIRAQAASSPDPKIRETLTKVESAPDLDTRLSLLSSLFDGLGVRDDSVTVAAPPRPGQKFDDASRIVTADLLRGGLMGVIAGTWAGDELTAFYASHPLVFRVAQSDDDGTIGWYQGGVISVNEDYISKFLKLKNRDIRDLQTDPALLANLTADFAPNFVHEATHHRQEAWRDDKGLSRIGDQNAELEAKQVAALFVLEKSMRDPGFRATLENDAKTDGPARSALRSAEKLRELGPAAYRDTIRYTYSNLPSLEGGVHALISRPFNISVFIKAELSRRAALSPEEAARFEQGPSEFGKFANDEEYRREILKMSTPVLREAHARLGEMIDEKSDVYAANRDRENLVDEQVAARLNQLLSGGPPPRRPPEVPSPVLR